MSKEFIFDADIVGPWVCEKAGGEYHKGDTAIGLVIDGELKAGLLYNGYTGASISMHSRCDDKKAPNMMFYWLIFDYPFNQLKVKRISGIVSSANKEAQEIDEKLGFVRETILRDYFLDGDAIVYVMRRENCRWLELGKRYATQFRSRPLSSS